jgi:hypothetical protein
MDRMYSLTLLIDHLDLPNRGKINGPYLSPWKLSENYDGRQARALARDRDERAAARACDPGLAGDAAAAAR